MKKKCLMGLLLALTILLFPPLRAEAAEIVDSGTCGENLTWTLDSEGTLTVSGEGEMKDYGYGDVPWYDSRLSVKALQINRGVTSIGRYAFNGCSSLTSVTIPVSITNIADMAFGSCDNLMDVYYKGTQQEWNCITIGKENYGLQNAYLHLTENTGTEDSAKVIRVFGENRFATAIAVANELKETLNVEKFQNIIIASAFDFSEATAGSYLANVKCAPILLGWGGSVRYGYLDTNNIAYIRNNLAQGGTVYLLGGTSAVPESYEEILEKDGITVKRLEGTNRFNTNLAILKEAGIPAGSEILVCDGYNFADTLSAAATGKPILIVWNKRGSLYGSQAVFLAGLQDCTFTIIGGKDAVCSALERALESYGEVDRIGGENRLETSVMVAEKYFQNPTTAVITEAWSFADGMCGGALAYAMKAPLILADSRYKSTAANYLGSNAITSGIVLGGPEPIKDSTVREIFGLDEDAEIVCHPLRP